MSHRYTTEAYKRWKDQIQKIFDFSVLMSYAVPALKMQMTLLDQQKISALPRPDYYKSKKPNYYADPNLRSGLRRRASGYKEQLTSYMLLSLFSYFEAYVIDIIKELMEFHGGHEKFLHDDINRRKKHIETEDTNIYNLKRKLTGKRKPQKKNDYILTSSKLISLGYTFPSDLFSSYGIKMLTHKLGSMTSKEIPEVLESCFHMKISEHDLQQYHGLREIRNQIAHGRAVSLSIDDVTKRNEVLTKIALQINKHFSTNYFIFNDYV